MEVNARIEASLNHAVDLAHNSANAPAQLASALRYACIPGGARVRPTLLLSVAIACGDDSPRLANAAAAALELVHCASLVHDDLPYFDDADYRRGRESVHRTFSEPLGVLAGDALILLAFETLAQAAAKKPERAIQLILTLAQRTGMPEGACAGQGWECEPEIDLSIYHEAKTGSLFRAATQMGAIAAGADPEPWTELGARIGMAYQAADDLRDAYFHSASTGKPAFQDAALGRPNAASELGCDGALKRLNSILHDIDETIPDCPGRSKLVETVHLHTARLIPSLKT